MLDRVRVLNAKLIFLYIFLLLSLTIIHAQNNIDPDFIERKIIGKWKVVELIQNGTTIPLEIINTIEKPVVQFEPKGKLTIWDSTDDNNNPIGKEYNGSWKIIHRSIIITNKDGQVFHFYFLFKDRQLILLSDPLNGEIWLKFDDALY